MPAADVHHSTSTTRISSVYSGHVAAKIGACLLALLSVLPRADASLQAHRPSSSLTKPCDKPCFNGGSCVDGKCNCPPGWTGLQCESCFGRVKKSGGGKGYLTDGPLSYSASARCIWIVESDTPGPILFRLEDFLTECCWDHLYIYDGDGVYNKLIAAFSGSLSGREVLAPSGKAIVYFISDLAFNLPGFNLTYSYGECLNNCSGKGTCSKGKCECFEGYHGDACQHETCSPSTEGLAGPCQNGAKCQDGKCACPKRAHGDNCQSLSIMPAWDAVLARNSDSFAPRASHKGVLVDQEVWLVGGVEFEPHHDSFDIAIYNINKAEWRTVRAVNTPPLPRYDHSVAVHKRNLYVYGGVVNQSHITNELWMLNMDTLRWTLLSYADNSPFAMPLSVAGHTAHFIGNEMYVFFGYNPFHGYVHQVQVYSTDTKGWRHEASNSVILGRFGHSSVVYYEVDKRPSILVYGGYNAPLNSYSYAITDELLIYDPSEQTWTQLGRTGIPLFRHSAVLLDGVMLIVGGNSHNESSNIRRPDCYSSQVLAFDAVCKKWMLFPNDAPPPTLNRYGHVAVANDLSMFIIGGFNGVMLNDVMKLTPAQCDAQATTAEECENHAHGVRCVFVNKSCKKAQPNMSYLQSFTSFIKNEAPRLQANCDGVSVSYTKSCSDIKDCADCLTRKGCGWCESTQACLTSDVGCIDGLLADRSKCPLRLGIGQMTKKVESVPEKLRPCNLAANCFACRELPHCLWFAIENKHICVSLSDAAMLVAEHRRAESELVSLSHGHGTSSSDSGPSPLSAAIVTDSAAISALSPLDGNSTCPVPCAAMANCQTCVAAQCMWCPSSRRCVGMDTYMISFPYGQCQSWITAANTQNACQLDPYDCEVQKTCAECQSVGPRCGWCDDGSETGLGRCLPGSDSGPLDKTTCAADRWYFTGQPTCQCNGHSKCNSTTAGKTFCRRCADKTTGDQCNQCIDGFYGDPRNGGSCKECQCNGEATSCNPESGDCYCYTKGVTGPHCDRCEPKYIGDPKNNRPCTYELIIDFIFTFKLDDDAKHAKQIFFSSRPFKRDTDVQFNIICEGDSGANVSVSIVSNSFEGHEHHSKQLMLKQPCTGVGLKRTYSAADPGYAFGTEANTTFYVKVTDFVTPIKVQISFAQSPPINWVLFFVIFAACFIVLLVVAGLLWMIKLRVEWYRNLRRRHDEIEEMASRPFASVQLELTVDHSTGHATPISVEPCSTYTSGVYTLVVRLPTGGRQYTPYGTSGLAVASAMCQLTQAQLALLQPPDPAETRNNRKHNLRRFIPFIRN